MYQKSFLQMTLLTLIMLLIPTLNSHAITTTCANITGDKIDVSVFGANGFDFVDDTAAVQNAMNCLYNRVNLGYHTDATLYFPSGTFFFAAGYRVSLTDTNLILNNVYITGAGVQSTVIHTNNDKGVFYFATGVNPNASINISKFRFNAGRINSGTVLEIRANAGHSSNVDHGLVLRDIEISGPIDATPDEYFQYGVRGYGIWRPLLKNVLMAGAFTGNYTPWEPDTVACFLFENAWDGMLDNVRCWDAQKGLTRS